MNYKIKNILAYISIFLLLGILGITTYYKYFDNDEISKTQNQSMTNEETKTKSDIRDIKNLENIKTKDFSLTDITLVFNDDNQVITITGNVNNLTDEEKNYKILFSLYNKDKNLINSKQISIDTKIQPKDTIPFFINHYYDEFEENKDQIKYYELKIK